MSSIKRWLPDLSHEREFWKSGIYRIGGIDEAGRGAWAGPVFAAVVVLTDNSRNKLLLGNIRDSKQMTPLQRERWRPIIMEVCLAWGVGQASNDEIDELGIVPATRLAAQRALEKLGIEPEVLLLDYLTLPAVTIQQKAMVRGDQKVLSIAAASILAKTERDRLMNRMDAFHPGYSFQTNKGYGTVSHKQALDNLGVCKIHRMSFKPVKAHLNQ